MCRHPVCGSSDHSPCLGLCPPSSAWTLHSQENSLAARTDIWTSPSFEHLSWSITLAWGYLILAYSSWTSPQFRGLNIPSSGSPYPLLGSNPCLYAEGEMVSTDKDLLVLAFHVYPSIKQHWQNFIRLDKGWSGLIRWPLFLLWLNRRSFSPQDQWRKCLN